MAPKRTNDDFLTDDFVVSDDHSDTAPAKKSKKAKTEKSRGVSDSAAGDEGQRDDEGGIFWEVCTAVLIG